MPQLLLRKRRNRYFMIKSNSYEIHFSLGQKISYFIFGLLSFRQAFKGDKFYLSINDINSISNSKNDNVVITLKPESLIRIDFFSISRKLNLQLIEENQNLIKSANISLILAGYFFYLIFTVGIPVMILFFFFKLPVENFFASSTCDATCAPMILKFFIPPFCAIVMWLGAPFSAYSFQKMYSRLLKRNFSYPNVAFFTFVLMSFTYLPFITDFLSNPHARTIFSNWKQGTLSAGKIKEIQADIKNDSEIEKFKSKMADSERAEAL